MNCYPAYVGQFRSLRLLFELWLHTKKWWLVGTNVAHVLYEERMTKLVLVVDC